MYSLLLPCCLLSGWYFCSPAGDGRTGFQRMTGYLWTKYADYLYTRWERQLLWTMIEPYKRPRPFKPLIITYVAAFYTGIIGAAITEQLHKVSFCTMQVFFRSIIFHVSIRGRKQERSGYLFLWWPTRFVSFGDLWCNCFFPFFLIKFWNGK